MKLYREMLRKLTMVGLPLLAVTMVYTLVTGGQAYFGQVSMAQSASAIAVTPILQYYVFTAVIFALYGFSFLFSRAGSDVYHSLPVKRTDLYVSVLLATATWMGATILLNVLEMLLILLISGCPFVPAYIPLSILFYFVASMLVFGAAAVGCALSGTVVTALASTGLVLLLPRFVQFLFARGIVERVPIVGWMDLGALLDPTTNIATGILAMHLRSVYVSKIMTLPHILYSALPMLVLLCAGLWLFLRRPSEFSHKNGGYRIWTVVMGILLAFTVMMPVTMNHQKMFSVYGAVLMAAALAVFFVCQLIAAPKLKQAFSTLPFFLLAVFAVLGISLLIESAADNMLNATPTAAQIESVTFRGYDEKAGDPAYTTLLIEDVAFTDGETKEFVSQALRGAVEKIKTGTEYSYYNYNPYQVIEPVTIHLAGGGEIKRTIAFENVDQLNALRMQNEAFDESVREFPPLGSVQYLYADYAFTKEETRAILESYVAEALENNLLNGYYYRERSLDMLPDGTYLVQGEGQTVAGMTAAGYVDSRPYNDNYTLRLDMPKTVSLVMRTFNGYAGSAPLSELEQVIDVFDARSAAENDSLSIGVTAFNFPDQNGMTVQEATSFYLSGYSLDSAYPYDKMQIAYMRLFVDLLSRAEITDDPNGLFVRLDWYYYDAATGNHTDVWIRPTVYLRFANETDEQEFLNLMADWWTAQRTF